MKVSQLLPLLAASTAANAAVAPPSSSREEEPASSLEYYAPPQRLLASPDSSATAAFKIPTSYESAVMARRILALTPLATFSTVFPSEARPAAVAGVPIGLSDYIADCEEEGNPTILSLRIGTTFTNVRKGSNISVSLAWVPPYPPSRRIRSVPAPSAKGRFPWLRWGGGGLRRGHDQQEKQDEEERRPDPMPYSGANLPRFSLMGYLEKIGPHKSSTSDVAHITSCYVAAHPDAKYWLPGNPIHEAEWVRLVVTSVYWIGGFGDRAYIGWIPVDEWRGVTREEWEAVRLPGEKPGWKEWSVEPVVVEDEEGIFGDL